ncbi:uncharacterized protein BO97DRAFT_429113 [Aspergillus homomorphus CBS 101889]|uniref:Uncharacterized protein n=1 Tax=Aspergillus homomorphus (strain CBS 101889) TaxID=1450537 RepID=A0A395HL68_ASPHC|nr:hypothetical protein BO97DRAFT_429113 [Aspergillus homomorphus CBS 101889]RAL07618.1 hypothetical protein BO97DRAFT_429113 [Aspergillus homomorphus CBS 101889]
MSWKPNPHQNLGHALDIHKPHDWGDHGRDGPSVGAPDQPAGDPMGRQGLQQGPFRRHQQSPLREAHGFSCQGGLVRVALSVFLTCYDCFANHTSASDPRPHATVILKNAGLQHRNRCVNAHILNDAQFNYVGHEIYVQNEVELDFGSINFFGLSIDCLG